MHPLLHTKDNAGCEQVMQALEECHAKGFMWKAAGMCNDAKEQLAACLRAERAKNQDSNRNGVQDKQARIRQRWKEIEENS
ncbi:cytochrome c oxidase biogenesis protein Cmc1-like protein [Achaetomium macrosporum]|uniref:COX assembly mitochondrial protein n=1 Tax=Achaetomium macrosporum TaxID=79813 RepID=A0AAN7C805_9PEZI|nr:cytochrome c oxidase biogenesis protein Cmc1-like protein [Achaetomium macrosporum]